MKTIMLLLLFVVARVWSAPSPGPAPRCGNPDLPAGGRHKRFALEGTYWRKARLTYTIYKYPANPATIKLLTRREIDSTIKLAFSMWSGVAAVDFERKDEGDVDIRVGWETGDHGDGQPFDGKVSVGDNVIAHGFYPFKGGDLHFDDDDVFGPKPVKQSNETEGVEDLFEVATHEMGHVLGLEHSEKPEAFMWPYVHQDWTTKHSLSEDDVTAVVELYGTRGNPYVGRQDRDFCQVANFDAAYVAAEGYLGLLQGDKQWEQTPDYAHIKGRKFKDIWTGSIPSDIDTATEVSLYSKRAGEQEWFVYLFKDNMVYEIPSHDWKLTPGYPKKFSETVMFRHFPPNLDGVFVMNDKIFYVKNSTFGWWKNSYTYGLNLPLPLPLPVEPPFDDVFIADDLLYFLKGDFLHFYTHQNWPVLFTKLSDITGATGLGSGKLNMKTKWLNCNQVP